MYVTCHSYNTKLPYLRSAQMHMFYHERACSFKLFAHSSGFLLQATILDLFTSMKLEINLELCG